jgi:hypothetical protein
MIHLRASISALPRPRARTIFLAMLALLVPLPAFALNGGSTAGPSGPAEIAVSVSRGDCGLAETQIVCELSASWSAVEDADYYTISVTRADGSVVDYGQSTGTGTSLWVPYVGAGTYSVQIDAWGTPEDDSKPAEVIARDRAMSTTTTGERQPAMADGAGPAQGEGAHDGAGEQPVAPDAAAPGAGEEPGTPHTDPVCEEPETEPEPEMEPDPGTETPAGEEGVGDGDELEPETAAVSAETEAALAAEAELPESVSCP